MMYFSPERKEEIVSITYSDEKYKKDEKDITNLIWEEVLIAFAGGVLPHYEHVNGISVKVGKDCDMICIWFGEFNKVKCVQMRDDFKMFLQIPQCVNVKLVSFERMK